jgi:hypothetical protein
MSGENLINTIHKGFSHFLPILYREKLRKRCYILEASQPSVEISFSGNYARVEIDLFRTNRRINWKGVKKINGFLSRYTIARQVLYKPYGATRDVVTAYVHREDLDKILKKLLRMVRRYSQPIGRLGGR